MATSQSSHSYGFPGTTPVVSSAGTTSGTGIAWALDTNSTTAGNGSGTDGPAVLYAYDALNLGTELWNGTQGSGNAAGNAVKFCVPTVANGKVYVGTQTEVDVYGLLPN
jgi:outer membrane protein assembly factor BamB